MTEVTAANAPTPPPPDVDDEELAQQDEAPASGGTSPVVVGLLLIALAVGAFAAQRAFAVKQARERLGILEHELGQGQHERVLAEAQTLRARLSGDEERWAAELIAAARALEDIRRQEPRLERSLQGGSWRVAKAIGERLSKLDPEVGADAALIALLRTDYEARVTQTGAPKSGRSTTAGVWCALLARLSTDAAEKDKLRQLAAACSPRVGAWLGVRRFVDPVDGATMLLVPGGTFRMGMPPDDIDSIIDQHCDGLSAEGVRRERIRFGLSQPVHTVALSPYYIERTEVSNARFSRFIGAGGYDQDPLWVGVDKLNFERPAAPAFWGVAHVSDPKQPVIGVSWYEATAYARWAHKLLPTEAQWEFAAGGSDGRHWPWGSTWKPGLCVSAEHAAGKTKLTDMREWLVWRNPFFKWTPASGPTYLQAVDSMPGGASPFGALHMSGNANEWCRDWIGYTRGTLQGPVFKRWFDQPEASRRDPVAPETLLLDGKKFYSAQKVSRGGDFTMFRSQCRVNVRYQFTPNSRAFGSGFRCVLPAGPTDP